MGTTGLLRPAPVFPDKAGVEKYEHFPKVQEFLFDSPVQVHRSLLSARCTAKKIPESIHSIRGFPFFIL
jgi:hypothetical protein